MKFVVYPLFVIIFSLVAQTRESQSTVLLIPQWHLSPGVNTKTNQQVLPQQKNQMAIYNKLVSLINAGNIKTIIVEGCEGEITHGYKETFNGWNLSDLEVMKSKDIQPIVTHVGLKIEAQYKDKVRVICGDNLDLIKKNQLAYSDIRGLFGFKTRLEDYKNQPPKKADYIKTIKEVLHLPNDATEKDAISALNRALKESLNAFKEMIQKRNDVFLETAKNSKEPSAIIIGALHIKDLEMKLKSNHISVERLNLDGLVGDEEKLIETLEAMLSR